jgi:outer membrane protein OmpA-like peptidoglycan-associated protein
MADLATRNDPGDAERLKELLFGEERALLRSLDERTKALHERVGDDAALAESVRRVIVNVLRDAGVDDHEHVAEALAPLVVHAVAREVPRHAEPMAAALRPMAWPLLRSGASSGLARIADGIEGALSPVVWGRRAAAAFAGRPMRAARIGSRLWLEGAILLDRREDSILFTDFPAYRSGRIVLRGLAALGGEGRTGPVEGQAGRDRFWVISDDYLAWFVVAHGEHTAATGQRLAGIFLSFAERWNATVAAAERPLGPSLVQNLRADLSDRCLAALNTRPGAAPPRPRPWFGYGILAAALMAALAYGGYLLWQKHSETRLVAAAQAALAGDPDLGSIPLAISYDDDRNSLIVRGVVAERGLQDRIAERIDGAVSGVGTDVLVIAPPPSAPPVPAPPADAASSDQVQALTERLNAIHRELILASVPTWFAQQTIQFDSATEYTDPPLVEQQMKAVAEVFRQWPSRFFVRVVGYADSTGGVAGQEAAALARALRVVDDLIAAGVPGEQLSAVGRGASRPISIINGEGSLNRRVEFEVYTPVPSGG